MAPEDLDRKRLEELAEAGASVTVPASLLLALIVKIVKLEEEVAELKRNSRNSSKPPSSDRHNPNRPEKKTPRKRGGRKRKPGGQKPLRHLNGYNASTSLPPDCKNRWDEHFITEDEIIAGLTPTGRAAAQLLNMNATAAFNSGC